MNQMVAIYARVSSDHQKEQNTIASQLAALREYAQTHQYTIGPQWSFEDAGYSGSSLSRPALERLRDAVAEGLIESVLVYSPDRLSRNFAHQLLLTEEFARQGAKIIFLNAPRAETAEEKLMLQLQGMIAEYERAQIVERCRRGMRHRAKSGSLHGLASAPYGYRYIRKTESSHGYYEIHPAEAEVVRQIFALYTLEGRSIRGIARQLNRQNVPTRSKKKPWGDATVWYMLKNPAYYGRAAYGKRESVPVQRVNRISRQQNRYRARQLSRRPRPPEQWIEIAVPAIISKASFDLAQERLALNRKLAARRTQQPSVVQGIIVCAQCGYAFCRASVPGAHGRLRYYRCGGLDYKTPLGKRVCDARPVRVAQLDELVWEQIWQLLNHPELIRGEIQRRLQEQQQNSPTAERKEKLAKELARVGQQSDKLIDAYQEGLLDLTELRQRVPELKKRQQSLEKELASLSFQAMEESRFLEVSHSMEQFVAQLKNSGQMLAIEQKQKIVRLLVREVVVGPDTVTIHHSIPLFRDFLGQNLPHYRLHSNRQDR